MKKYERFFYIAIIVALFGLIYLFYSQVMEMKKSNVRNIRDSISSSRIFSFNVQDGNIPGNNPCPWVQFTAYSSEYYLFITFSPGCPQCLNMLDDFKVYFSSKEFSTDTQVYLISSEGIPRIENQLNPSVFCIQIAPQDMVQFGNMTPSIFAVNGQGKIIHKRIGYSPGAFDEAFYAIQQDKNNRTRSIKIHENR